MFADTPLWNASEDDITVVVDFLAAHMETLMEVCRQSSVILYFCCW